MIKRVSLVRLRRDRSREECLEAWLGPHGRIVKSHPDVLEYVVDVAKKLPPEQESRWDAVATLRFHDEEAMSRCLGDPEIAEALARTRREFAEDVSVMVVDEFVLVPSPGVATTG